MFFIGPTRTTAQVFTIEASHSTSVPFAIFTLQSTSMLIETSKLKRSNNISFISLTYLESPETAEYHDSNTYLCI